MRSFLVGILYFISLFHVLNAQGGGRGSRTKTSKRERGLFSTIRQQTSLTRSIERFSAANNGYYTYQLQKSCVCSVCNTQAMNILVEDNIVSDIYFAEGNDYSLNNFCFGDQNEFDDILSSLALTINDIFDIIQDSLNKNKSIGVTYHRRVGFPQSISINTNTDTSGDGDEPDTSVFFSINCLQFDLTKTPSPSASNQDEPDTTQRSRRNRTNRRNRDGSSTREDYNEDDPSSCQNIQKIAISRCPIGYFYCHRFSDGCNTCTCNEVGDIIGCTSRICDNQIKQEPRCVDCESNTEWSICGGDRQCIPNCDHPDDYCGIEGAEEEDCNEPRCECPGSISRWDGYECISIEECEVADSTNSNNEFLSSWCVEHCDIYSDGCLSCECDHNRKPLTCDFLESGADTSGSDSDTDTDTTSTSLCTPLSFSNRECIQCEDPSTMTYTMCGKPDVSCEEALSGNIFPSNDECIEKCSCNDDTPIYNSDNGKCITISECDFRSSDSIDNHPSFYSNCIEHCPVYFNGCNACQCPDYPFGAEFCSNIQNCDSESIANTNKRDCFRCEVNSMRYTQCGKCDRTCDDPNPSCLDDDECIEKCECPLGNPIFDVNKEKCITFEQCSTQNNNNFKNNAKTNDEESSNNELKTVTQQDGSINSNNNIQWEVYVVYGVIAMICIIVGIVLLCWPNCIRLQMFKHKQIEINMVGGTT